MWFPSRRELLMAGVAVPASGANHSTAAEDVSAFFRGKQLRFLVGIPPGGAYDLIARTVADHISRYIPGQPTVVVENMPGASSLVMMNYLYNVAPRDGTVVGFPMNSVILEPSLNLISRSGGVATFDLSAMTWLGSVGQDPTVLWVGENSSIRTFDDLHQISVSLAATTTAADSYSIETLCNRLLDTKIQLVSGYEGVAQYLVAFERGEVDGAATTYAALAAARPDWIVNKRIRFLAQFGSERSSALPDLPTGVELAPNDDSRAILQLFGLMFTATYPVVLGPNIPSARAQQLGSAFDQTMRDPDFASQIKRLYLAPGGVSADKITKIVQSVEAARPEIVLGLKSALRF